jgi:hypothetical protein
VFAKPQDKNLAALPNLTNIDSALPLAMRYFFNSFYRNILLRWRPILF